MTFVAIAYAATTYQADPHQAAFVARVAAADARTATSRAANDAALHDACGLVAGELRPKLPEAWRVVVREPFVIASDLGFAEVDRIHRDAIVPVTSALWRCYFDRRPDKPITLVLLGDEAAYQEAAMKLDRYEPIAYAGYYQRSERRIVLNLASGYGTLTHELCHALAQFDFPELPEWLDEGLAALHEETQFSDDRLQLIGLANWRCKLLPVAIQSGELPSLHQVINRHSFRGEGEGLNYALVRSFCRYLQHRGLLTHYYRKFRAAHHADPSGLHTLCEVLGVSTCDEIDASFRAWITQ